MKIGVDLRSLQIGHQFRGIGMYISNFIEQLSNQDVGNHDYTFFIYDVYENPLDKIETSPKFDYKLIRIRPPKETSNKYTKFLGDSFRVVSTSFKNSPIPNLDNQEVFLQFDVSLGVPKTKKTTSIVVSYDLIPLVLKNEYLPSVKTIYLQHNWKSAARIFVANNTYKYGIRNYQRADHIIAISENTRETLSRYLGIDEEKITAIPLALPKIASESNKTIKKKIRDLAKEERPYIFFVGGIDPRRKVDELVAAYNNVRSRGYELNLVIAGKEFEEPDNLPNEPVSKAITGSSYKDGIHLFGFISNEEKAFLYKHALAFVYPTRYEGFGLPILEGMASSCPVITYRNSSIPEVGADAVLYADDFEDIANQIESIISNPEKRTILVKKGLDQADNFSWSRTVTDTLALIDKVSKDSS